MRGDSSSAGWSRPVLAAWSLLLAQQWSRCECMRVQDALAEKLAAEEDDEIDQEMDEGEEDVARREMMASLERQVSLEHNQKAKEMEAALLALMHKGQDERRCCMYCGGGEGVQYCDPRIRRKITCNTEQKPAYVSCEGYELPRDCCDKCSTDYCSADTGSCKTTMKKSWYVGCGNQTEESARPKPGKMDRRLSTVLSDEDLLQTLNPPEEHAEPEHTKTPEQAKAPEQSKTPEEAMAPEQAQKKKEKKTQSGEKTTPEAQSEDQAVGGKKGTDGVEAWTGRKILWSADGSDLLMGPMPRGALNCCHRCSGRGFCSPSTARCYSHPFQANSPDERLVSCLKPGSNKPCSGYTPPKEQVEALGVQAEQSDDGKLLTYKKEHYGSFCGVFKPEDGVWCWVECLADNDTDTEAISIPSETIQGKCWAPCVSRLKPSTEPQIEAGMVMEIKHLKEANAAMDGTRKKVDVWFRDAKTSSYFTDMSAEDVFHVILELGDEHTANIMKQNQVNGKMLYSLLGMDYFDLWLGKPIGIESTSEWMDLRVLLWQGREKVDGSEEAMIAAERVFRPNSKMEERVNAWWGRNAEIMLLDWKPENVTEFFVDAGLHGFLDRVMKDKKRWDGTRVFEFFLKYDEKQARRYRMSYEQFLEAKMDLWNELAMNEEHEKVSAVQKAANEKCHLFCSHFELDYTFGLEWSMFPVPNPWPNPIHTFTCNPTGKWGESDTKPIVTQEGSDGFLKKLTKYLLNKAYHALKGAYEVTKLLIFEMGACASCGVCILFFRIGDALAYLGQQMQEAWSWITGSASKYQKNKQYQRFANNFESSLLHVMGGQRDRMEALFKDHDANAKEIPEGSLLEKAALLDRMNEHNETFAKVEELIDMAQKEATNRVPGALEAFWQHKLPRRKASGGESLDEDSATSEARQNRTNSQKGGDESIGSSVLQTDTEAEGTEAEKAVPTGREADHMALPEECEEIMTESGELKKYLSAYSMAVNLEEPAIGDAVASLMIGNFAGALENLVPEVLLFLLPVKPKYGKCLYAPEKLKEAQAMTCTEEHRGMCMLGMKHNLFYKMAQQDWPPVMATFSQRSSIENALQRAVVDSCLSGQVLFGYWRGQTKQTRVGMFDTKEDDDRHELNEQYRDCELLTKLVRDHDGKDGQYSSMIWYASVQSWIELKKREAARAGNASDEELAEQDNGLMEGRTKTASDAPDVEPFIYQFCHSFLNCDGPDSASAVHDATRAKQKRLSWREFLQSFKPPLDEGKQKIPPNWDNAAYRQAKKRAMDQRIAMYKYWGHENQGGKALICDDDKDAIDKIQNVYVDKIKPRMQETIDTRQDPFEPVAVTKPMTVNMFSATMHPPFDNLFQPAGTGGFEGLRNWGQWAKEKAGFHVAKKRQIWLEAESESGCPKLMMKQECDMCDGCSFAIGGDGDNSTAVEDHNTISADKHHELRVMSCSRGGAKKKQKCQDCLSERQVAYIVDCNEQPENEFYSMEHPVQQASIAGDGSNTYLVLHTFWRELAKNQHTNRLGKWKYPFRRTMIEFTGYKGYEKMKVITQFFQTIRQSTRCSCACETLKQYRTSEGCIPAFKPGNRSVNEACIPKEANVARGFCCATEVNKDSVRQEFLDKLAMDPKKFARYFACANMATHEQASQSCESRGGEDHQMTLCHRSVGAHLYLWMHKEVRGVNDTTPMRNIDKLKQRTDRLITKKGEVWTNTLNQQMERFHKCLLPPTPQDIGAGSFDINADDLLWPFLKSNRKRKRLDLSSDSRNGILLEQVDVCMERTASESGEELALDPEGGEDTDDED
eukprot:TRINITY_DN41922_c0_g2_i1.p1 TRINITY_DN41922_c0_g2~~TRINITY_DN41922_c0_g2_i1.p1  ORF type:complete len:1798 (-),score=444.51 TRINITY_DN41922_c0_g2_i1:259-5652(-)